MLECLRWGPTSLQTVKMNECEFYTVCTQLGAGNIKLKHTSLRKRTRVNCNHLKVFSLNLSNNWFTKKTK